MLAPNLRQAYKLGAENFFENLRTTVLKYAILDPTKTTFP
jgi:hypothetical protein